MSKNKAATENQLSEIHRLLALQMKKRLEGDEDIPASELAVIVKFLKDNNIEAVGEQSDELKSIASQLPDLEDFNPEETFSPN